VRKSDKWWARQGRAEHGKRFPSSDDYAAAVEVSTRGEEHRIDAQSARLNPTCYAAGTRRTLKQCGRFCGWCSISSGENAQNHGHAIVQSANKRVTMALIS